MFGFDFVCLIPILYVWSFSRAVNLNFWCFLPKPVSSLISNSSDFLDLSLHLRQVSSHSESSSQSLSLQPPPQQQQPPPPPPPPPPQQPQYGLPVPELRDKQLCFSDFEDLSASFRSLYKCVFEQSFSQQGGSRPPVPACVCVSAPRLN